LIKDNHVDFAGGIKNAVEAAYKYLKEKNLKIPVVVEVRNFKELEELLAGTKVDRVLLDNFSFDDLKKAVKLIDGRIPTEASGGITPKNAIDYATCGVNFISMGALTHSVKSLDMSLKAVI
jgi:nicotinate-nucleotide pyrophosphorylase (carboxylating)